MKVIFLDFDGAICTSTSISEACEFVKADKSGDRNLYHVKMIDIELVQNINTVIDKTGAMVVISSSWRDLHTMNELLMFLRVRGFRGKVVGRTPVWKEYKDNIGIKATKDLEYFWNHERGNEINMWLQDHDIDSFIIIDDEVSDIFPVFPDNYIQTDMEHGFHKGLIQEAIDKLNKETK